MTPNSPAFDDVVGVLVSAVHNLLRNQRPPTAGEASMFIDQLRRVKVLWDENRGGAITTEKLPEFEIHMIRENQNESTEGMLKFLWSELTAVVERMEVIKESKAPS